MDDLTWARSVRSEVELLFAARARRELALPPLSVRISSPRPGWLSDTRLWQKVVELGDVRSERIVDGVR